MVGSEASSSVVSVSESQSPVWWIRPDLLAISGPVGSLSNLSFHLSLCVNRQESRDCPQILANHRNLLFSASDYQRRTNRDRALAYTQGNRGQ